MAAEQPDKLIAELQTLYHKINKTSEVYRDMWEDQVMQLEDLIAELQVSHYQYLDTDWASEDRAVAGDNAAKAMREDS